MSFAKYSQLYKDNGFYVGSKIKATVTDSTFIGEELVLSKGNDVIRSITIPASGKVDFFTDESGTLTLSADNGTSVISGIVEITNYSTYYITLNGSVTDNQRDVYADKTDITLDDNVSSDTVSISYTGDVSSLGAVSSNQNVATATINNNKVTVNDAGKGFMGKSDINVTVQATKNYQAKNITIHVEKTNGTIDKSWTGLKNIVEEGREAELCQVGEEFSVTLSNGRTMTYLIGAIDHDYDNQIIFVPKRYDYLDKTLFTRGTSTNRYENSSLCSYLNNTFFEMLPSDMQEVISEKTVQYAIDNSTLVSYTKKIWLPREYEILGTTEETYSKEREIYRIKRLPCFTNNLVTLFEYVSSSYNGDEAIATCSIQGSYIVIAFRYKNSPIDKYDTYHNTSTQYIRPFPCFHIIKET